MRLRLLEWLDTLGHRVWYPGRRKICNTYDRELWAQFDYPIADPAASYNYGDLER